MEDEPFSELVCRKISWSEMIAMQTKNSAPIKGIPRYYAMQGSVVLIYPNPHIFDGFK